MEKESCPSHPPRNPIHCEIPTVSDAWTGQRKSGEEAQENTHSTPPYGVSLDMIYRPVVCFLIAGAAHFQVSDLHT